MRPGLYDWPPQYAGDTGDTMAFVVLANDIPTDLTGATIKMQVRDCVSRAPVLDLSSAIGAAIVITDPTNGKFRVGYYQVPDLPGAFRYDLEITSSAGAVKTYLQGSFIIEGDVTK